MKKFITKNYIYLLSFILGLSVILLLYIINDVSPFGSKSLLTVDFFHQYGPMLGEYYDRIWNGSNLLYSFNSGLGLPIFRNFLNYLASPFNFIILLFKREHLLTAYSIIIALKCAFANTTMTYYLTKKFKTNNLLILGISILYTFQSYFIAYYWNIMWIDGLVFLPLIVLGIEKIINEDKWKLYTLSLALMLLINYFIGYMICIYSVLYFLAYLIYKTSFHKKSIKNDFIIFLKRIFRFGISSLLSGAIAAFMLIPLFTSISSISATHDVMPTSQYYDFQFGDFIKGHLTSVNTTVFASDTITNPNVSCGIISVALLLLFILNYKIPIKKKICYLALLLVIAACFFVPQLDFIMHAFHVPNDLPYRYSFLYSFTMMIICAYSMYHLKDIKYIIPIIVYILLIGSLILLLFNKWEDITNNIVLINMIILTLLFIFYSYVYFYKNMYIWFTILFVVIASVDATVSTNRNWNITHDLNSFYYDFNEIKDTINDIEDDDLFYRVEKTSILTFNDPTWYNYHGVNIFSSMAYENMAILQGKLGMPGNKINSYYYVHQTPIYDMLFNIKYFIGSINDYKRYEIVGNALNKYKYSLPIAYAVNKNIKEWDYLNDNPFEVQNDFIAKSTNIYDVLSSIKYNDKETLYADENKRIITYKYENPNDNMYFHTDSSNIDFFIIGNCLYYKNENYLDYIDNIPMIYNITDDYNEERIINILSQDDEIEITVGYNYYLFENFDIYKINHNLFTRAYEELSKYSMTITSFKENDIKGTIYVPDDMTLYTSIPYDEGWNIYIDGKLAKTEKLGDTLLITDIKKGNHTINFKYHIPNFIIGYIISSISIIYIVIDTLKSKRKKNLN